ncbi:MAG: putative O-linked N-acetylglucosamine transferase, family [Gemmatimonadetes bacterium]|nr:putative O-linked N-acetylglucosamine transferase, family [Gemmatimonadota bacterium]
MRTSRLVIAAASALLALSLGPRSLAAQHEGHANAMVTDSGMPLFRAALGPFTRRVTTSSADAQSYFDQGVQLMYSFARSEAVRSFREAERRDSTCAMCWWGEAWSRGAYLNEPMDSAGGALAHAAAQHAKRLAATVKPQDAALIEAMTARYAPAYSLPGRPRLDSAYASAMASAYARYPKDQEVATLYAEALMLLEPRRGQWSLEKPSIQRIHQVLEGVLAADRTHPGACHLYVHATESTSKPEKAEWCADLLGSSIPGASHINHMPSHTYNRVGRWGDAVRANLDAWHTDQRSVAGQGFTIYPSHNLHMLLFAACMDGQGAVAEQAARDYAKITAGGSYYRALVLMRFGRFAEVLELHAAPTDPVTRGLWDFARGYAHLRLGAVDSARFYLAGVDSSARDTPASVNFRGHTAAQLLGLTGGILRAELERHDGKLRDAIGSLQRSVAIEDSLRYDEPEPLNFSARDWLGAALLEDQRAVEAEQVYRTALVHRPRNGWDLLGLEQSLSAQGRTAEAADVHRQFIAAWARSDSWITSSRF